MSSDPTHRKSPPRAAPVAEPVVDEHLHATISRHLDQLEANLGELQAQVLELQRMASIGTMSAILAHEFNNLLTPILTYTQYALSREDPQLWRTAAERSNKNAQRLAALCQRILGFTSNTSSGPSAQLVKPLLTDVIECLGRDVTKDGIQVEIDAPDDLKVVVDAGALQQVLFNLVLNAWQAMLDRPGRLTLSARAIDECRAAITIRDTGCGIPPENLPRIFEPFFTTKTGESKSYRRGSGLGLHVCRRLVEEQGGMIEVESAAGSGTTFSLTLPRAPLH